MHTHCKHISDFSLFFAPLLGLQLEMFLSVCCGLDGIDILSASFQPATRPLEENPGGVIFCSARRGLVPYWRKELSSQVFDGESESVVLRSFLL